MDEPRRTSLDRLALALTAPLAFLAVLRITPGLSGYPFDAIEAFLGWALAPAWLSLALALARRRWLLASVALPAVAVHAYLALSLALAHEAPRDAERATVRVASVNLYAWNHRQDELAREIARLDVDLLALVELTPEWLATLDAHRALAPYPHRVATATDDCFGIALYSRAPLRGATADLEGVPLVDAQVDIGAGLRVIVAHTMPPLGADEASQWNAQLDALAARVTPGATVLTGDLNASPFGRGYRTLLARTGLRGAHELAGRPFAATWPNGTQSLPPLRLDHVLVSPELDVLEVHEGEGAGSDHRPVVARLALP